MVGSVELLLVHEPVGDCAQLSMQAGKAQLATILLSDLSTPVPNMSTAWQEAYAPAIDQLTGTEAMLDVALTGAAGLCDCGLLDMFSALSWRGEYVYKVNWCGPRVP